VLALALGVSIASAQQPGDTSSQQDAAEQLEAAQAEARANAVRPGDEDLSCEALQTELMAMAQSMQPGVQAFGQQAAADLAEVQTAQQAAEEAAARSRPRFGQMMRGMATGVVPGMDRASAAAQQAESIARAGEAQAETNANLEQINALAAEATAMAGPVARGERVLELAKTRNCAWLEEGGAGMPGAFPPGAVPPESQTGAQQQSTR
jgi:hypothetical protein